jgi:hypothetical protein
MNEFNTVSTEELTKVDGGNPLLIPIVAATVAAGAVIIGELTYRPLLPAIKQAIQNGQAGV